MDGDGRIALSELKTMLNSGRFQRDIPDRVVAQIIKNADIDKDGYLEFDEFIKLVSVPLSLEWRNDGTIVISFSLGWPYVTNCGHQ